ncbi:MAG TPA: DUF1294 domain-containing protein [Thermoclostridium sp.]
MESLQTYITVYLILINITGFLITGLDKYWAIHKKWRMAEKRFMLLAVLGGGLGVYIGCRIFHHKTRHQKFMIGIPAICIIETAVILFLAGKF